MTRLLAQFFECCMHDLGMAYILQLLEVFGGIFNHELEALRVVLTILSVN